MLEAYAVVVCNERMIRGASVDRCGKRRGAVKLFLISLAEREEEFVLIRKTVVDAHRPGCVQNRTDSGKKEVVSQLILVRGGGFRNELEDILCHCTKGNFIIGESRAAHYPAHGLGCGWVEDLSLDYRSAVARIGTQNIGRDQKERKIANSLLIRRHSASSCETSLLPVLLPGEKEERLVMASVQLGNPHWSTHGTTVVVFLVNVLGLTAEILKPFLRV